MTEQNYKFKLDVPPDPTDHVVVFLPGISGGAFTERFQPLVTACLESRFAIARLNIWEGAEDVGQKSFEEIYRDLGEITTHLHQTYPYMFGIGKSFGGAVMLTFPSVYISKKVLWAPAIGVTESGSNVELYRAAKLGTAPTFLDIQVDRAFLEQREAVTLVIHGTADDTIPLSNSETIVSMLPHANLLTIENADHSYKNKTHETELVKMTIDFLKAD